MPRLYLTPTECLAQPLALGLASVLAQLPVNTLDTLLFAASQECDSYCKRRLCMAQPTTTGGAVAGSLTLPVASTLGWDGQGEEGVIVGTGSTQEMLRVVDLTLTSPASPYPGTLTLATALQYAHNPGETVQGCLVEVMQASRTSSENGPIQDVVTQEYQMATAHRSLAGLSQMTRKVFVKNYPVWNVNALSFSYAFDGTFSPVATGGLITDQSRGIIRLAYGTPIYPGGYVQVWYQAGMRNISYDIKQAVMYFVAASLRLMNSSFATGIVQDTQGRVSRRFAESKRSDGTSQLVAEAQAKLEPYRRKM